MPIDDLTPSTATSGFEAIFGVFAVIVVLGIAVSLFVKFRNVSRVIESGNDPITFETDLAIKAMNSQALAAEKPAAPARSTAERLAELDSLLAAGAISSDEHAAARAQVLREI